MISIALFCVKNRYYGFFLGVVKINEVNENVFASFCYGLFSLQ